MRAAFILLLQENSAEEDGLGIKDKL